MHEDLRGGENAVRSKCRALVDPQTLAVVAVTQSRRSLDPKTEKLRNESFGVPIETVGAALARAWVERPADAGDDDTDALIADWIDRTSRAAGPRHTWETGGGDTDRAYGRWSPPTCFICKGHLDPALSV